MNEKTAALLPSTRDVSEPGRKSCNLFRQMFPTLLEAAKKLLWSEISQWQAHEHHREGEAWQAPKCIDLPFMLQSKRENVWYLLWAAQRNTGDSPGRGTSMYKSHFWILCKRSLLEKDAREKKTNLDEIKKKKKPHFPQLSQAWKEGMLQREENIKFGHKAINSWGAASSPSCGCVFILTHDENVCTPRRWLIKNTLKRQITHPWVPTGKLDLHPTSCSLFNPP